MASTTSEDEIDGTAEDTLADFLQSNVVLLYAEEHMASKARRRRIRDGGSNDKTSLVANPLRSLHDRTTGFVVGRHANSTIVTLLTARKGRSAGGTISDEGVAGSRPTRAPEVLIQCKDIVDG